MNTNALLENVSIPVLLAFPYRITFIEKKAETSGGEQKCLMNAENDDGKNKKAPASAVGLLFF